MAPLGSPTKTTTSPPSTTGLPMIAPSASPGSGDRLVPGRAVGAPCRPRRPGADTEGDEAGPVGGHALRQPALERRRAVGPGEAVIRRPGEGDVAGAGPQDHGVVARRRAPGRSRRRTGSDRTARPVQRPAASRIQIAVTDGCAQSPSPSPRVRTRSPQADRSSDRARGPGERLARPGRAAIARRPGDAPFAGRSAGADRDDRARQRDDIGDRRRHPPASGCVDQRPGEIRRTVGTAVAGGASLGEATATGVGAAEAAGGRGRGDARLRRPAAREGERQRRRQPGTRRGGAGRGGGTCPWDAARAGDVTSGGTRTRPSGPSLPQVRDDLAGGVLAVLAGDPAAGMGAGAREVEARRARSGSGRGRAAAATGRTGRGRARRASGGRRSGRSRARDRAGSGPGGR